ncbi:MAG TPA: hypothetical protein VHE33_05015 [Acidobacteriaceae bacterium]|nr:hypothetical protein [Acidobacteriaceae bacterium]
MKTSALFCSLTVSVVAAAFLVPAGIAQTAPSASGSVVKTSKPARPGAGVSSQDVDALRRAIEQQQTEQQQQLDQLRQQNDVLAAQLRAAEEQLSRTQHQIDQLGAASQPQITDLQAAVAALKTAQSASTAWVDQQKKLEPARENPTGLRYRGLTLVPGGYFSADGLFRSHAENADINTSFAAIPWDAAPMSHQSEFRATARATRLTLRASGAAGRATVTGYFETDFLGSGFAASEVQTNGYSNRVRQMWGRVQFPNGWTFAGGQMWSLITMNRTGIENLTEYAPGMIDATILPGYDYARQTSFRVTRRFTASKSTVAFSLENAATVGNTPANVPSSIAGILSGLSTTGTGVLSNTTYSTNVAPDLIGKIAFDPRLGHFEIKAVGRTFRDRLNSTATVPGKNNTLPGGAIGASAYLPVGTPKVSFLAQAMYGAIGRYGATSTDVIVKPDGSLSAEKSIHGITGFEYRPSPRMDTYLYGGEEYLPRNYGYGLKTIDNSKCFAEAGFSCSAGLKVLDSAATGFWYRFYKGPGGTLQYGASYIYILKEAWSGVGGAPHGVDNIVESSFRYYIP